MADLIELDVVVREKGLKQSLSTVERLERQLTKAAKAIDENRISQDRYNKILLSAKRQYEALGLSSQKATASVRKFAESQRGAMGTTDNLTNSIKRQTEAQMAATKQSNRMGVVTQQAGYQVSDFIVQVQSGTNVFVAFGQQASQLVGILPLMASSIGLTTGAAIALSAALGIIIPLVTAVGAAFLRAKETSADAGDALYTFKEASTAAAQEVKSLTVESYMLTKGIESSKVAMLDFAIAAQEAKTAANDLANEASILFGPNGIFELGGGFTVLGFEIVKTDEEKLALLKEQRQTIIDQNEQLRIQKANKQTLIDIEKAHAKYLEEQKEAQKELDSFTIGSLESLRRRNQLAQAFLDGGEKAVKAEQDLFDKMDLVATIQEKLNAVDSLSAEEKKIQLQVILQQLKVTEDLEQKVKDLVDADEERLRILKVQANTPIYEPLTQAQIEANKLNQELIDGFNTANDLKKELGEGAYEALRLAGVDIASGISAAQKEAAKLAADLGVSLEIALAMSRVRESQTVLDPRDPRYNEDEARLQRLKDMIESGELYNSTLDKTTKKIKTNTAATKDNRTAYEKAMMTAQEFADALDQQVLRAVDGVADAFSDFLAGGLKDFKSFVGSIKDMFIRLLADMAAMALKQRIIIPIATGMAAGFGSSAAASTVGSGMGSFAAGTIGSTLATGASAFGAGFTTTLGMGTTTTGATAMALNPTMASIGAAVPYLIAVAAVVGLLTKKTKLLDSGLRATVEGFDVAIETFKLTQSSRLFGLLKGSKVTSYEAADAELADPLIEAIGDMQQSIVDAAGTLGIGADAFDNFSYQFKVSLKGLTEEEQLQKINEEITKMGDSFASLSGHFETMNELLAVANQRYDIETRILQLLGNETELLIRQRERERAATHELNRGMLDQVYALEDAYSAVNSAFATVQRSIEARKNAITNSFNEIMETIQGRVEAAQAAVGVSGGVLSSLEGASGTSGMTRGAGLAYLRSLRGASRISDQKKLDDALEAIAEPSQDLYTNFVDYQRDFQDQSNLIRELEEKARYQLSTDEQTLLEIQNEADAAQARYQGQIDKLDEQLAQAQEQLNALYGINTSVKDVSAAIADLSAAVQAALSAQAAAKAALGGGGTGAGAGVQQANAAGQQILNQLGQSGIAERKSDGAKFQKVNIRGSAQLLQVASDLGVKTSGRTGAEIQQAISNAGNLGVNMDNATRALQFAMGGNFGGGLRMVGERGPELEATGPSRIFSTKQTAELFRNPELVAEVKNLREEVAGLRSEQRQLQASNSKYVKRNYDINRKWDTEGLPATRT